MSKPHFVVPVRDLEDGPRTVEFELSDAFLRGVFEGTEAVWAGPGSVEVELTKNGREVMVRGHASVDVTMPCARTMAPVPVALRPDIFLMLSQSSSESSLRKERPRKGRRGKKGQPAAKKATNKKERSKGWSSDPTLSEGDTAMDSYDGEEVVLDSFVREFILLDLPMNPVSSDLPTEENAAIPRPPAEPSDKPIDPRLAPLAAIAARLRKDE